MICALELYKYFGAQDPLRFGSRMHKARAPNIMDLTTTIKAVKHGARQV
jgi:hypothetical protein